MKKILVLIMLIFSTHSYAITCNGSIVNGKCYPGEHTVVIRGDKVYNGNNQRIYPEGYNSFGNKLTFPSMRHSTNPDITMLLELLLKLDPVLLDFTPTKIVYANNISNQNTIHGANNTKLRIQEIGKNYWNVSDNKNKMIRIQKIHHILTVFTDGVNKKYQYLNGKLKLL